MKKYRILLLLGCFICLLACKKDRIEEKKLNEYAPINDYLDSKKQEEQEFVIDGTSNDTITGNQGTRLLAGKDCLMFPNGDSVAYPFTVKLVELYTPKDMIYWQIPTVATGNILETDGEVRVRAVKDGQDLVLKDYCFYQVMMPNSAPTNDKEKFLGFTSGSIIDWTTSFAQLGVTTNESTTFGTDSYGYIGNIPRLGWLNCGKLANNGSGSTVAFSSETDVLTNVGIFIYFPDTKSVMQVYNLTSGLIPNGTEVKIILMAQKSSGELYHTYINQTINGNTTFDVELQEISDANLTSILDNL